MQSLTARGRALVAAGLIGAGAGWGFGQSAVIAVAALLVTVPLIGVIVVRRSRFVLGTSRRVAPTSVAVGEEIEVVLTVENGSRLASGLLLLSDEVPEALGHPTRLLLDRVPAGAQRSERYRLTTKERGRTRIGPVSVLVTDPFGTASVVRSFTSTNPVLVTPVIVPLGTPGRSRSPGGRGESMFRSLAARGDDDLLPREHRPGDDFRQIHWRATARHGELMVRREEQAWHSSIVVILDDRDRAHAGSGPSSTFEWAVSAAASICLHYLRQGWRVTALTATGRVLVDVNNASSAEVDALLGAFADVQRSPDPMAAAITGGVEGSTAVIAVLGRVTDDATRALARPMSGFAGCLVLEPGPLDYLRSQGWQVSPWSRGTSVAAAWAGLEPASTRVAR